jgi:hypothetical protein
LKKRLADENDIRRRIDAITGKVKPTAAMVQQSIQPLIDKLTRQARIKEQNEQLFVQHMNGLARVAPGEPITVTRKEAEAVKAFEAALIKRTKSLATKPPKIELGAPLIKSSSILTVDAPAYNARWTDGSGASANHIPGNWSTGCSGNSHSYAGVCAFFTPQAGRFPVRFAPYMPHNYNYLTQAYTPPPSRHRRISTARSGGFLGTFVSAWNGRQWVEIKDVRNTLWDVSLWNGSMTGSDDTAWDAPQAEFITLGAPLVFALWAWGGVWTSETKGTQPGFGHAWASLSTSIPFMVIEQKI